MIEGLIISGLVVGLLVGMWFLIGWYWKKIGFPGYGPYIRNYLEEKKKSETKDIITDD